MRLPGIRAHTTEHFRRDGRAKRSFDDQEAAEEAAERQHANAYHCRLCKRWHIGGKRKS